jgi:HNH endonuclease
LNGKGKMPHTNADPLVGEKRSNAASLAANHGAAVQNKAGRKAKESRGDLPTRAEVLDTREVARFWSRVEVRKDTQCWPWRYGLSESGYGEFLYCTMGKESAHRVAYRIARGSIPAGMVIRHACDNPACCNPDHLELGTHADNVADRVERNRSAVGENNGRAILNDTCVEHIRRSKFSTAALASHYEVHEDTIRAVREGRTWKHI